MKFKVFFALASMLFLGACEMGHDQKGPYKAYLQLKNPAGKIVNFYLGGYSRLSDCLGVAKYEAAEAYAGKYFWTNQDYSYGGVKQDGWTENEIVGAFCNKVDADEYDTTTVP